jgi:hypothetical protein
MTLIINGKHYTLDNDEWMYQAKDVEMAQGGAQQAPSMGPVGPQLLV